VFRSALERAVEDSAAAGGRPKQPAAGGR